MLVDVLTGSPLTGSLPTEISAVFLDRDGTLNVKAPEGSYITSPHQLRLLRGVGIAVRRLNELRLPVFVVTNQRGVALRKMTLEDVGRVNDTVQRRLRRFSAHVDGFYVCPHDDGVCDCRKPAPGMLWRVRQDHPQVQLHRSVIIGDSEADVEAGLAASAHAIRLGLPGTTTQAAAIFPDLLASVEALIRSGRLTSHD